MKTGLLTAWLAQVAIITYRGVKTTPRTTPLPMPLPSTYVSSFIIYGGLSLLPAEASTFAGAIGWGLVAATLLNLWTPGGALAPASGVASSASSSSSAKPAPAGGTK